MVFRTAGTPADVLALATMSVSGDVLVVPGTAVLSVQVLETLATVVVRGTLTLETLRAPVVRVASGGRLTLQGSGPPSACAFLACGHGGHVRVMPAAVWGPCESGPSLLTVAGLLQVSGAITCDQGTLQVFRAGIVVFEAEASVRSRLSLNVHENALLTISCPQVRVHTVHCSGSLRATAEPQVDILGVQDCWLVGSVVARASLVLRGFDKVGLGGSVTVHGDLQTHSAAPVVFAAAGRVACAGLAMDFDRARAGTVSEVCVGRDSQAVIGAGGLRVDEYTGPGGASLPTSVHVEGGSVAIGGPTRVHSLQLAGTLQCVGRGMLMLSRKSRLQCKTLELAAGGPALHIPMGAVVMCHVLQAPSVDIVCHGALGVSGGSDIHDLCVHGPEASVDGTGKGPVILRGRSLQVVNGATIRRVSIHVSDHVQASGSVVFQGVGLDSESALCMVCPSAHVRWDSGDPLWRCRQLVVSRGAKLALTLGEASTVFLLETVLVAGVLGTDVGTIRCLGDFSTDAGSLWIVRSATTLEASQCSLGGGLQWCGSLTVRGMDVSSSTFVLQDTALLKWSRGSLTVTQWSNVLVQRAVQWSCNESSAVQLTALKSVVVLSPFLCRSVHLHVTCGSGPVLLDDDVRVSLLKVGCQGKVHCGDTWAVGDVCVINADLFSVGGDFCAVTLVVEDGTVDVCKGGQVQVCETVKALAVQVHGLGSLRCGRLVTKKLQLLPKGRVTVTDCLQFTPGAMGEVDIQGECTVGAVAHPAYVRLWWTCWVHGPGSKFVLLASGVTYVGRLTVQDDGEVSVPAGSLTIHLLEGNRGVLCVHGTVTMAQPPVAKASAIGSPHCFAVTATLLVLDASVHLWSLPGKVVATTVQIAAKGFWVKAGVALVTDTVRYAVPCTLVVDGGAVDIARESSILNLYVCAKGVCTLQQVECGALYVRDLGSSLVVRRKATVRTVGIIENGAQFNLEGPLTVQGKWYVRTRAACVVHQMECRALYVQDVTSSLVVRQNAKVRTVCVIEKGGQLSVEGQFTVQGTWCVRERSLVSVHSLVCGSALCVRVSSGSKVDVVSSWQRPLCALEGRLTGLHLDGDGTQLSVPCLQAMVDLASYVSLSDRATLRVPWLPLGRVRVRMESTSLLLLTTPGGKSWSLTCPSVVSVMDDAIMGMAKYRVPGRVAFATEEHEQVRIGFEFARDAAQWLEAASACELAVPHLVVSLFCMDGVGEGIAARVDFNAHVDTVSIRHLEIRALTSSHRVYMVKPVTVPKLTLHTSGGVVVREVACDECTIQGGSFVHLQRRGWGNTNPALQVSGLLRISNVQDCLMEGGIQCGSFTVTNCRNVQVFQSLIAVAAKARICVTEDLMALAGSLVVVGGALHIRGAHTSRPATVTVGDDCVVPDYGAAMKGTWFDTRFWADVVVETFSFPQSKVIVQGPLTVENCHLTLVGAQVSCWGDVQLVGDSATLAQRGLACHVAANKRPGDKFPDSRRQQIATRPAAVVAMGALSADMQSLLFTQDARVWSGADLCMRGRDRVVIAVKHHSQAAATARVTYLDAFAAPFASPFAAPFASPVASPFASPAAAASVQSAYMAGAPRVALCANDVPAMKLCQQVRAMGDFEAMCALQNFFAHTAMTDPHRMRDMMWCVSLGARECLAKLARSTADTPPAPVVDDLRGGRVVHVYQPDTASFRAALVLDGTSIENTGADCHPPVTLNSCTGSVAVTGGVVGLVNAHVCSGTDKDVCIRSDGGSQVHQAVQIVAGGDVCVTSAADIHVVQGLEVTETRTGPTVETVATSVPNVYSAGGGTGHVSFAADMGAVALQHAVLTCAGATVRAGTRAEFLAGVATTVTTTTETETDLVHSTTRHQKTVATSRHPCVLTQPGAVLTVDAPVVVEDVTDHAPPLPIACVRDQVRVAHRRTPDTVVTECTTRRSLAPVASVVLGVGVAAVTGNVAATWGLGTVSSAALAAGVSSAATQVAGTGSVNVPHVLKSMASSAGVAAVSTCVQSVTGVSKAFGDAVGKAVVTGNVEASVLEGVHATLATDLGGVSNRPVAWAGHAALGAGAASMGAVVSGVPGSRVLAAAMGGAVGGAVGEAVAEGTHSAGWGQVAATAVAGVLGLDAGAAAHAAHVAVANNFKMHFEEPDADEDGEDLAPPPRVYDGSIRPRRRPPGAPAHAPGAEKKSGPRLAVVRRGYLQVVKAARTFAREAREASETYVNSKVARFEALVGRPFTTEERALLEPEFASHQAEDVVACDTIKGVVDMVHCRDPLWLLHTGAKALDVFLDMDESDGARAIAEDFMELQNVLKLAK